MSERSYLSMKNLFLFFPNPKFHSNRSVDMQGFLLEKYLYEIMCFCRTIADSIEDVKDLITLYLKRIVREEKASSNVDVGVDDGHFFALNNNDEVESNKFEVRDVEKGASSNVNVADRHACVKINDEDHEFCKSKEKGHFTSHGRTKSK